MNTLNAFGEALQLAAMALVLLTASLLLLLGFLWKRLVPALLSRSTGSVANLLAVVLACLLHGSLLALYGSADGDQGLDPVGLLANATVGLPVGALILALGGLLQGRRRNLVGPVAALGAIGATLAGATQIHRFRQLDHLPARIEELSSTNGLACARLTTGQVVCVGSNREGQRGHGYTADARRPTVVVGLSDATRIWVAPTVACALRKQGPAVCWGGAGVLIGKAQSLRPWILPSSEGATTLAVTDVEIAGMRSDGSTFGWPHPLPKDLSRVRALMAASIIFHPLICAINVQGRACCLEFSGTGAPPKRGDLDHLGEVVAIAPYGHEPSTACALKDSGDVACSDSSVLLQDVEQLVFVSGYPPRLCARQRTGSIRCWGESERVRERMKVSPGSEIFALPDRVCSRQLEQLSCQYLEAKTKGPGGVEDSLLRLDGASF
jgi:hypothetical protein